MKCLDLFCKAGGCTKGYQMAGFHVTGVDIEPQPRYVGDKFILGDALEVLIEMIKSGEVEEFDLIAASPPCQAYSVTKPLHKNKHPELIEPTRELLKVTGKPYVIENVEGAPLINPLMLCGTMFPGLRVYRHRLFECNPPIWFPPVACNHSFSIPASKGEYHTLEKYEFITCVGHSFQAEAGRIAMGIDWMTRDELAQAIPPAYTKWIGEQMKQVIKELSQL
jgi:DNA (cytosine-5)-methyltransferase 1